MTKAFDLVQCISDHHEVMFANNYYFRHPSSLAFFVRLSWTFGMPISDRSAIGIAVTAVLCHKRVVRQRLYTPDVPVGSGPWLKCVLSMG